MLAAYAVVGLLQITVWNPLAAMPGMTLEEIHAAAAGANEPLEPTGVIIWAAVGPLLAVLVLIVVLRRPDARPLNVIIPHLLLVVMGTPSYWSASFTHGMSLADTFGISGGDHAPWGKVLYAVSALALIAFVVIIVVRGRRPRDVPLL
ncbi:hypothetical protein GCM10027403_34800 [Arthrobacter tecti]